LRQGGRTLPAAVTNRRSFLGRIDLEGLSACGPRSALLAVCSKPLPSPLAAFCASPGVVPDGHPLPLTGFPGLPALAPMPSGSTITMIITVGGDGKQRGMVCIPLRRYPMWLAIMRAAPRRVRREGLHAS
jgi:hypothetical protein